MRLRYLREHNSIRGDVTTVVLNDFVVISGVNGAGKSNLLEAIHLGAVEVDGVPPPQQQEVQQRIRLFGLAQLAAADSGPQTPANFRDRWVELSNNVQTLRMDLQRSGSNGQALADQIDTILVNSRHLTQAMVTRMSASANKRIAEFSEDDFRNHTPYLTGVRDPFGLSVGEVFLSYHERRNRNWHNQWVEERKGEERGALSDAEFVRRHGPPPWDVLNETLEIVGLDYRFEPPSGSEETVSYEATLFGSTDGAEVRLNQLSSGERTLLAIAMSLYSGSAQSDAVELPKVLLLDETDASLHPSMIRSLLRVVHSVFCEELGVKVLLTTHSPTTVALAPEGSIHVMRRDEEPRLVAASRDEALGALTVGIPTLTVRNDGRRQVFVESEYDESNYRALFRILAPTLPPDFSLEFVASGRGGGGSVKAVLDLVRGLRAAGNLSVYGLVDRDDRQGSPAAIEYVPDRYSRENVVLDPVPLGIFLLREHVIDATELGLPSGLRHFEVAGSDFQAIVDSLSAMVGPPDEQIDGEVRSVTFQDGVTAEVPAWWLECNGHDLERRIRARFPQLNRHRDLGLAVIEKAMADVPTAIPAELSELFGRLLEPVV